MTSLSQQAKQKISDNETSPRPITCKTEEKKKQQRDKSETSPSQNIHETEKSPGWEKLNMSRLKVTETRLMYYSPTIKSRVCILLQLHDFLISNLSILLPILAEAFPVWHDAAERCRTFHNLNVNWPVPTASGATWSQYEEKVFRVCSWLCDLWWPLVNMLLSVGDDAPAINNAHQTHLQPEERAPERSHICTLQQPGSSLCVCVCVCVCVCALWAENHSVSSSQGLIHTSISSRLRVR